MFYIIIFCMKKIIWLMVFLCFILFSWNIFAFVEECTNFCLPWETQSPFPECDCIPDWSNTQWNWNTQQNNPQPSWNTQLTWNTLAGVWMTINTECLVRWQCGMNLYELLWIRRGNTNPTVMSVIQDVILAATTFVWTLVVVALVISWLLFAIASISWKDTKRAKTIMVDCFVWLLLVIWSYTIIRLIQFLALAWK